MPAQRTGIQKDEKVRVITVDALTGETSADLTSLNEENTSTRDSVDGSSDSLQQPLLDFRAVTSLQAALDSFQSSSEQAEKRVVLTNNVSKLANDGSANLSAVPGGSTGDTGTAAGGGIQVVSVAGGAVQEGSARVVPGKRPNSTGSPVVTKVIITKNPNTSQPQAVPVQLGQFGGQTVTISSMGPNVNVLSQLQQQQGSKTPTKTITISQKGIVSPVMQMAAMAPGTPPKVPINKIPISPARSTPTKITMIPVTIGKSPQKIAPATTSGLTFLSNSASNISLPLQQSTITMSPSKVINKPGTVHLVTQKAIQPAPQTIVIPNKSQGQTVKQVTVPVGGNVQQIHVPGNKFHYIRLAAPQSSTAKTGTVAAKSVASVNTMSGTQMKITIPAPPGGQLLAPQLGTGVGGAPQVQRILLPAAPNQVQIRPAPTTTVTPSSTQIIRAALPTGSGNLSQLAATPGTSFVQAGPNVSGVQGFALVPASYLSHMQLKQSTPVTQPATPVATQARQEYIPIASSNPALSASTQSRNSSMNGSPIEATGARPRKPCNCTKSQCLKLYCDCFANGEFCHNCNCMNCANNLEHEEERSRAIKSCLDRNPLAFHPKIGKGRAGEKDRRHNKGCNCKRSGCLKNYCECYEAKIMCGSSCKCVGCKNFEESPERKTLMHLADAAEVRVQQQTAAKTKLSSQISDLPSRPPTSTTTGERLPFSFVTAEVAEATCACLLAQAEEAERLKMPPVVQERMVIEEFGRCLLQIIESANKTKAQSQEDSS